MSDSLDTQTQLDSLTWAKSICFQAASEFEISTFRRVGVRQWFAVSSGSRDERSIINKLTKSYLVKDGIDRAVGMKFSDFSQILEFKDPDEPGKGARLVVGGMSKKQWQELLKYDPSKEFHLTPDFIGKMLDSLPEAFVYLDTDRSFASVDEDAPLKTEFAAAFVDAYVHTQCSIPRQILQDIDK